MLFPKKAWPGLADGSITVAYRRWKRPTVKADGTLHTPAGVLAIDAVTIVDESDIDEADAHRSGHASRDSLMADLGAPQSDRHLFRIDFHHAGDDPRVALRETVDLTDGEFSQLLARLARLDRVAPAPWTLRTLAVIAARPGVVSTELAERMGMDRAAFKQNVRKLKTLGLTESLEVGYRISPRGVALRARLADLSA